MIFELPKLPEDATSYQIINFIRLFRQAAKKLQWTTGPKLFKKFILHLEGDHMDTWLSNIEGVDEEVDEFWSAISEFKQEHFEDEAYENQKDFLRTIKKTRDLDPRQFLKQLRIQDAMLKELPGAPAELDDAGFEETELKKIYLSAMPKQWRQNFVNANLTVFNTSLINMRNYFYKQAKLDPYVEKNNTNQSSGGNSNTRGNSRRYQNPRNNTSNRNTGGRSNNSQRGNNGGRGNGNTNNRNFQRPRHDDDCPIHGPGHTWGQCYINPNRNTSNNQRNQNQNQRRNGNPRNGESNVNERDNNSSSNNNGRTTSTTNNNRQHSNENANKNTNYAAPHTAVYSEYENCMFEVSENQGSNQKQDPESFLLTSDDLEPEYYESDTEQEAPEIKHRTENILKEKDDTIPSALCIARKVNTIERRTLMKALFDTGGSHTMIQSRSLPKRVEIFQDDKKTFSTTQGRFQSSGYVYLHEVAMPEFSYTRRIKTIKAYVFDAPQVKYDLILGRKFLRNIKIKIDFETEELIWYDKSIKFHTTQYFQDRTAIQAALTVPPYRVQKALNESYAYKMSGQIKAAQYEFVDVQEVVNSQDHLSPKQRDELYKLLQKYQRLFNGKLGCYPKKKFKIKLKPGTIPYHCKQPFPVPMSKMKVTKDELDRQELAGILAKIYESEWGMPMFIQPKKDETVRTLADFRELNKCIIRMPFILPKPQDIFMRRRGYVFMTKLDISMQYYTFMLEEESTYLCVIVTPWGKYRYLRLPMGLTTSPDWAQAAMEELFQDMLHEIEIFIDDIGIFSNTWEEHLDTIEKVLNRLQENDFTINPRKCEWAVKETDFLGHWMTPQGLKPWKKKIEPILALKEPETVKQLRSFIGMVNYYRAMWKHCAHIMAPLTALTKHSSGSIKKHWTPQHSKAFQQAKAMICQDVLLAYPDPNKEFVIETDASDLQLGAVIKQDNKPVAFFSRKLNPA